MIVTVIITGVAVMALLLGKLGAKYYVAGEKAEQQREQTASLLAEMNTISVGGILPDHRLTDLHGDDVWLSEIVSERTLISFFYTTCDLCVDDFYAFGEACKDSSAYRYFVFITPEDPEVVGEFLRSHKISALILIDQDEEYGRELGLSVYPFSIIIDRENKIHDIISGKISPQIFERIIKINAATGT